MPYEQTLNTSCNQLKLFLQPFISVFGKVLFDGLNADLKYNHISNVTQCPLCPLYASLAALSDRFGCKKYHDLVFSLKGHRSERYQAIIRLYDLRVAHTVGTIGHHFL